MTIFALNSSNTLKKILKIRRDKCKYIVFDHKVIHKTELLKASHFEEVDFDYYSGSFKNEFYKAYIELVGRIGSMINSEYWWAGFTASKNRFMSKLLPDLLYYYTICYSLQENKLEDIFLISPPRRIITSLMRYCEVNKIKFKVLNVSLVSLFNKVTHGINHIVRIFYFILTNVYIIALAKRHFKENFSAKYKKENYYVLRTFAYLTSISNDNKFHDPFFGRLPDFLIENKKNVIVLVGVLNNYKTTIKKLAKCNNYFLVPQEYFLNYTDVIRVALDTFFNKIKLNERIEFFNLDVTDIVQEEIDKDYRESNRISLLQKYVIKNMLEQFNINTFTTTYENNPWEKVCFLSLRKYSPSTKIIGYQHAVVTIASANMFISKEEKSIIPMPDKIITVGTITKRLMEMHGCYPEERIVAACALRHEYIYKLKKKDPVRTNTILAILEGVPECYKLANFVFNSLKDSPYKIIIRTHPERPYEKIRRDLCFEIGEQNNVSLSHSKHVKDDLMASDIVIYWGSTVSLEALKMGIPVIHVDLEDMISVDPLLDCKYLKWTVKDTLELLEVISGIYSLTEEEYKEQHSKAEAYIESYLQKVTTGRLQEFVL